MCGLVTTHTPVQSDVIQCNSSAILQMLPWMITKTVNLAHCLVQFFWVCARMFVFRKCMLPAPTRIQWLPQIQTLSPSTQVTVWSGWWDLFWPLSSSSALSSLSSCTKSECDELHENKRSITGTSQVALFFKFPHLYLLSYSLKYLTNAKQLGTG